MSVITFTSRDRSNRKAKVSKVWIFFIHIIRISYATQERRGEERYKDTSTNHVHYYFIFKILRKIKDTLADWAPEEWRLLKSSLQEETLSTEWKCFYEQRTKC